MRKSVYDVVSAAVLEDVKYLQEHLLDGSCKDYQEYIHHTAWISAANQLLDVFKEALVKVQRDNDED